MDQEVLRNGVRLYYRILKAHRRRLTGSLRKLGDLYVRQEFHQHHSNPNPHYYPKFYESWQLYCAQIELGGLKSVAKPIDEHTESKLTSEQKSALKELEAEVKKFKN